MGKRDPVARALGGIQTAVFLLFCKAGMGMCFPLDIAMQSGG